jgi:hypothetical protein
MPDAASWWAINSTGVPSHVRVTTAGNIDVAEHPITGAECAFAASNTDTARQQQAWFGTGGAGRRASSIQRSRRTWTVSSHGPQ